MHNHGSVVVRRWLMKFGIAFFSAGLSLILVEVAFRLILYRDDLKIFRAFKNIGQVDELQYSNKEVTLREMIRKSDNSRIIYELIPGISLFFIKKQVTINSHGFRGSQYSTMKSNKTLHIVGLGDSLMFGWGVSDDENFLSLLSQYLNQSSANGYVWEVVNTAVPGYNTVMEIETLKAKGLQYNPDLVIIAFIGNDLKLPNFIRKEEDYFSPRRSFAIEYFSDRLTKRCSSLHDGLVDAPLNASGDDIESDPSRVPAQYRDMVGVDAYRSAMSELKALSLRQNFQVVVFTTYFPGFVKAMLEDLDLPILEAGDTFTMYMSKHGIKEYIGSPLTVSNQDPHPSALGHTILANVLYNYLRDNGILSSILERHRASSLAK